jgi:hypothetical protein
MKPAKPASTPRPKSIAERKRDSFLARMAGRGSSTVAQCPAESEGTWRAATASRYQTGYED